MAWPHDDPSGRYRQAGRLALVAPDSRAARPPPNTYGLTAQACHERGVGDDFHLVTGQLGEGQAQDLFFPKTSPADLDDANCLGVRAVGRFAAGHRCRTDAPSVRNRRGQYHGCNAARDITGA